ncbi:hypothetical protein GTY86_02415 [Streptomyces sp. SID5770]|nr:hypothetical protein [Streptomyces sp. SID5770]
MDTEMRHPPLPNGVPQAQRSGIVTACLLPAVAGRVTHITAASELQKISEVIKVDMRVAQGDVIKSPVTTSSASGIVYAEASNVTQLKTVIDKVSKIFTLEVENP